MRVKSPRVLREDSVTVWIEPVKMVIISSLVWLALSVIVVLLAGTSERSFVLFTPAPKWPVFALLLLLWCISVRVAYWWVFQRYTFYGSR
jgi:uncharacterized RDD family membrane protein YckC